jgi:hypothetical protein
MTATILAPTSDPTLGSPSWQRPLIGGKLASLSVARPVKLTGNARWVNEANSITWLSRGGLCHRDLPPHERQNRGLWVALGAAIRGCTGASVREQPLAVILVPC